MTVTLASLVALWMLVLSRLGASLRHQRGDLMFFVALPAALAATINYPTVAPAVDAALHWPGASSLLSGGLSMLAVGLFRSAIVKAVVAPEDQEPVLRRGLPTINALFSHQIAVIMGDYLYSRAIIELVRLEDHEALRVLARVTNEMTVGEMRQLEAHDKLAYGEGAYDELIRAKTASLLSGACEVGALAAVPAHRQALARFGMLLGMAFQITDDLLDYTQPEAVTGKPSGLDLREHKVTLPLIAALSRLSAEGRRVVAALMEEAEPGDDLVAEVIRLVEGAGGLETARQRALDRAQQADAELDVLPPSPARDALQGSIAYAVERRS